MLLVADQVNDYKLMESAPVMMKKVILRHFITLFAVSQF